MIGLRANISGVFGESVQTDENAWKFNFGILGCLDFNRSHDIPVGLGLGFDSQKISLLEDQSDEDMQSLIFKLAYTGREDYNIGLEFTHVNTTAPLIQGENDLTYMTTSIVLVYFF